MSLRARWLQSFADMPLVLKGITSFFVVFGVGSVLVAALPVEHRVGAETWTRAELWASGYAAFAAALGLWLAIAAGGLLERASWGIAVTVLAYAPFAIQEARAAGDVARQALLALAWGVGCAAYLFRTRGAIAYFKRA